MSSLQQREVAEVLYGGQGPASAAQRQDLLWHCLQQVAGPI